jgi:hypothetical protein
MLARFTCASPTISRPRVTSHKTSSAISEDRNECTVVVVVVVVVVTCKKIKKFSFVRLTKVFVVLGAATFFSPAFQQWGIKAVVGSLE